MEIFEDRNFSTKKKLDLVSPTFCLAKWAQTTLHLGLGHTHSCHHPRTHKIPLESIAKNPSALHNTDYKKQIRQEMLDGIQPSECEYCWKVENLKNENKYSDRILKSSEEWAMPFFNEILKTGSHSDINPRYLEVSFSNVCNFKCSYCMPSVSSQWMEEIERYGPYPTANRYNNLDWVKIQDKFPIPAREHNPYVEAFWKWLPELIVDLHTLRITGGEPLLDKNTFRLMEYLILNPQPNLEFSVNSNFDVPGGLFVKFIEKVKILLEKKCIKSFTCHTSCEAQGQAAEYIRFGLNYDRWLSNIRIYINEIPYPQISIMSTYNALSINSYEGFLRDILELKKLVYKKGQGYIGIDIPYLNHPYHLSVKILTEDFLDYFDSQIEFCCATVDKSFGFSEQEIFKLSRVRSIFSNSATEDYFDCIKNRRDFVLFIDEHDRRRKTDFKKVFPSLINFYDFCKTL